MLGPSDDPCLFLQSVPSNTDCQETLEYLDADPFVLFGL